ncbi:MAG: hypothetical protein JW940_21480 [Polyangiaceae bacterium]|nr:hypothetical protein [Polyangiaceae bacterium]
MNPATLSIALRPRTLLETCDLAFAFMRRSLSVYLTASFVALLLPGVCFYGIGESLHVGWPRIWLVVAAWSVLVQGMFTLLGGELLFASDVSLRRIALRLARSLLGYLMVLLVSLARTSVLAVTVVLAPKAFAASALIPEVVLLEGLRGRSALRRGERLGATLSRKMVGFGLLAVFGTCAAAVLAEALCWAVFDFLLQLGSPVGRLLEDGGSLYAVLGTLAAVPPLTTLRLLAYADGRARQDGWDIQVRFQSIRARDEVPL